MQVLVHQTNDQVLDGWSASFIVNYEEHSACKHQLWDIVKNPKAQWIFASFGFQINRITADEAMQIKLIWG